jgi:hypothetical protein
MEERVVFAAGSGNENSKRKGEIMTTVNLDNAIRINLPPTEPNLRPARFETKDGRVGWVTSLPGSKPIAAPAQQDSLN